MIVGAVSGVCFAAVAAHGLAAAWITPHFSRPWSVGYIVIAAVFSYSCFRAATSGRTDETSFLHALWGGFGGMVAGFAIVCAGYAMVRDSIRIYVARPLGLHLSQVTMTRLVLAFLLLGLAAGFALRTRTQRAADDESD